MTRNHAILRTAWVYGPTGKNFALTMLRLAEQRPEISVVADQHGAPSYAADLADAIIQVARNLVEHPSRNDMRGVFHLTNAGETTWAGFAEEIFRLAHEAGIPAAVVKSIVSADYPTLARRPMNSRLDCSKLGVVHGVVMPDWRHGLRRCMQRIQNDSASA